MNLERKEAKMEKEEAEKYKKLQDNLAERQIELQLFKLFHNERQIKENTDEIAARKKDIKKIEKKKGDAEEKLKEVKKDQGKSQREFAKVDSDIREKENAIQKKRPAYIKAKEKSSHLQKKVDGAKKSLKQAEKVKKLCLKKVQVIHVKCWMFFASTFLSLSSISLNSTYFDFCLAASLLACFATYYKKMLNLR